MRLRTWTFAALFAAGCGTDHGSAAAGAAASATAPAASATASRGGAPASAASGAATVAPASASSGAAPGASASAAPAADASRLTVVGKVIQGGVLRAKATGLVKHISFPGHKTTILEDGEFLIGFGRTALPKETLALTFDDGAVLTKEFAVEQRTYETDRIDGLPKDQVELDAATKKKVAVAEAKIDDIRMKLGTGSCFKETFVWPLKGKITSRYGQPRILNGTDAGPHWGVDLVAPVGTAVHAPACGKVVFVEKDIPLSGNVVIIDHGRGLTSTFIHLDKFRVKTGDVVKQGDTIATVGMTGRTTGAHLDWRMNLYDLRVDPELLVAP